MPPEEKLTDKTAEKPKTLPVEPANPTPSHHEDHLMKSLRSYQGDVAELVSKNNYSTTSIMLAEQRKREGVGGGPREEKNNAARNKFYIIVGSMLLILGVITIVAVYYNNKNQGVVVTQSNSTIIPFSKEKDMRIASSTRDTFLGDVLSEKLSFALPINSILFINTLDNQNKPAYVGDVLALLGPQMPAPLARSFDNTYMLGIYSFDTNEPFLILTTSDFASSYAGMLKWEGSMSADLGRIFSIQQNTGSSTPVFTDEALKNKDLRVLKDSKNKTVLLYSFVDKNTLLITANENIFSALLGKYLVGNQAR